MIWNTSQGLWHCCGDDWCNYNNKTVSDETFNAVGAQAWKPISNETTSRLASSSATIVSSTLGLPSTIVAPSNITSSSGNASTASEGTGLSDGAAIGIGVGTGVGAIVTLMVAVWLGLRTRRKRSAVQELHSSMLLHSVSPMEAESKCDSGLHEVSASSHPIIRELDAGCRGVEMP